MNDPVYVLRSQTKIFWAVLLFLIIVFLLVFTYLDPASGDIYQPLLIALGLVGVTFVSLLRPKLELTGDGIVITNFFRRTFIPWSSYQDCDTRFGLVVISQRSVSGSSASFAGNSLSDDVLRRKDQDWRQNSSLGAATQDQAEEFQDLVSAFPGRGGFSQVAAHVLNVEQGAVKSIPWHNHGKKKHYVRTSQVISLMRRMKEVFAKDELGNSAFVSAQRVVSWRFDGVAMFLGSLILVIAGVWLLNI